MSGRRWRKVDCGGGGEWRGKMKWKNCEVTKVGVEEEDKRWGYAGGGGEVGGWGRVSQAWKVSRFRHISTYTMLGGGGGM